MATVQIDHGAVSVDLVHAAQRSDDFQDWNLAKIEDAARRYQMFFALASQTDGPLAPTRNIDKMWHLHMLHPKAYYEDCMRVHGKIFDHDGGFGKAEGELPQLKAAFERTSALWFTTYGEDYGQPGEDMKKCWHDCQGRCWNACKS